MRKPRGVCSSITWHSQAGSSRVRQRWSSPHGSINGCRVIGCGASQGRLPHPAELATGPGCKCDDLSARTLFHIDVRTGALTTTGEPLGPEARAWILGTTTGARRIPPSHRGHLLEVGRLDGAPSVIAAGHAHDRFGAPTSIVGFVADPMVLAPAFLEISKQSPLLPPTLAGKKNDLLNITIASQRRRAGLLRVCTRGLGSQRGHARSAVREPALSSRTPARGCAEAHHRRVAAFPRAAPAWFAGVDGRIACGRDSTTATRARPHPAPWGFRGQRVARAADATRTDQAFQRDAAARSDPVGSGRAPLARNHPAGVAPPDPPRRKRPLLLALGAWHAAPVARADAPGQTGGRAD